MNRGWKGKRREGGKERENEGEKGHAAKMHLCCSNRKFLLIAMPYMAAAMRQYWCLTSMQLSFNFSTLCKFRLLSLFLYIIIIMITQLFS